MDIDLHTSAAKSRSPHGERGLKYKIILLKDFLVGRSPHGERGLKFDKVFPSGNAAGGRSPHGERGLKSESMTTVKDKEWSLPPRGAWIEIFVYQHKVSIKDVAPPTGSVD